MIDPRLKALIQKIDAKRPKTVLEHILKHGQVTTDELKTLYGYNHPPRAARDVRELGIPLITTSVPGPDGRKIAAYTLGNLDDVASGRSGRRAFPKALKEALLGRDGDHCGLCGGRFPGAALQVDHLIPYEITGDPDLGEELDGAEFMLACGSCNRSKSWSCEHCPNWTLKKAKTCGDCYWSGNRSYTHIATRPQRRLTVNWADAEVAQYERLAKEANQASKSVEDYVKGLLKRGS